MALSDDDVVDLEKLAQEQGWYQTAEALRELLAIRETRRYSDADVRQAVAEYARATDADPAWVEVEIMRRLRGEGGAKPETSAVRLQRLGFDAPKRDCDIHDLGQPGLCTCRGVPL